MESVVNGAAFCDALLVSLGGSKRLQLQSFFGARGYKKERIEESAKALSTSFAALPKNQAGNLEHQTARYILHRFFVQKHGWYIKGLEPNGDVFHANASVEPFKDWVPSYLLDALEKRLGHTGLYLKTSLSCQQPLTTSLGMRPEAWCLASSRSSSGLAKPQPSKLTCLFAAARSSRTRLGTRWML